MEGWGEKFKASKKQKQLAPNSFVSFAMFLSRILVKSSCLVEMLGGGQPYKGELAKRGGSSGWSWAIKMGK